MNLREQAIEEIVVKAIETHYTNPQGILEKTLKRMSDLQLFAAYLDIFGKQIEPKRSQPMKSLIVALCLIALPCLVTAADTSKNPDRFISVGLNYDYDRVSGDTGPFFNNRWVKIGENEYKTQAIQLDIRVPVNHCFTIEGRVRGNLNEERFTSIDQNSILDSRSSMGGSGYGLGVRYYFSR